MTLASIIGKLDRAERLVGALRTELCDFRVAHPLRIEVVTNRDKTRHSIRVFGLGELALDASFIAGEVLYHLRSTLDHIVYDLVRANGKEPTCRNGFPICDSRDKWAKMAPRKLRGVSGAAQKAVERLQPYNAADSNVDEIQMSRTIAANDLFVLNEFARIDRHRFMAIVRASFIMLPEILSIGIAPPRCGGGKRALLDGDELYWCEYASPTSPSDVKYTYRVDEVLDGEWDPAFEVTHDNGPIPVGDRLTRLCAAVRAVATDLEPFL